MKKLIAFCFMLFAFTAMAQTPDTLTPEKNARWKIGRIRDNTVRAITPQDFRNAFNALANLAVSRTPYMSMQELRAGKADTSRVVYLSQGNASGTFRYDPGDTTTPDDSVMTIVDILGRRHKREIEGALQAKWFGVIANNSAIDNTPAIQKAVRVAISRGGGDIYFPVGLYYMSGTVYINSASIAVQVNIISDGKYRKDSGTSISGATFVKNTAGAMFRTNLKADGTPFGTATEYQLNKNFIGVGFKSEQSDNVVYAIETYRSRATYQDLYGENIDALVMQSRYGPVGYSGWNNYCDQNKFVNINMYRMKTYGLSLCLSDASTISRVTFSYPASQSFQCIYMHYSMGFTIDGLLYSDANHLMTDKPGSAFIKLTSCRGFRITGIHLESVDYESVFDFEDCFAFNVEDIHERFYGRTLYKLKSCRNARIGTVYSWAVRNAGYFDLVDVDDNCVNVTYDNFDLRGYPDSGVVRPILISGNTNNGLVQPLSITGFRAMRNSFTRKNVTETDFVGGVYAATTSFDLLAITNMTGNRTIELSPSLFANREIKIVDQAGNIGSTRVLSIVNSGGGNINGASGPYQISTSRSSITLYSNGADFYIVNFTTDLIKAFKATLSGDGTATTFNIPHGVGSTPSHFDAQATTAAAGGISYVTADATNIIVHYVAAPVAGTNNLSYNITVKK